MSSLFKNAAIEAALLELQTTIALEHELGRCPIKAWGLFAVTDIGVIAHTTGCDCARCMIDISLAARETARAAIRKENVADPEAAQVVH